MTYRIAYSTNAYTEWPLFEAIRDIRNRGFDGVEILADVPHAFPPSDPAAIRSALDGFPVSNINGNTYQGEFRPSLIDPDPDERQRRIKYVRDLVGLAREIGAHTICTSSGFLPGQFSKEQAYGLMVDALREILVGAEGDPPVRVGIEYEPGFFIGSASELLPLLDEIHHPLLGVNLDVGHAVCVGEDTGRVIESFAGRIWNIHVEDIAERVHKHLVPGHGSIDFTRIREELDRTGYDGFLTLEIYPYKDRPGVAGSEGLDFLRRIFG